MHKELKIAATGATTLTLGGGKNYDGGTDDEDGSFQVTLAGLAGGYQLI